MIIKTMNCPTQLYPSYIYLHEDVKKQMNSDMNIFIYWGAKEIIFFSEKY